MANTAPLVEARLENVFLPQEHVLISYYLLRPPPKGTPSMQEVTGYYSPKAWRDSALVYIAHIATGRSWDTVPDEVVSNNSKYRPTRRNRHILLLPQVLFKVIWENSVWGKNGTEPVRLTYLVTYLPYYHVFVVVETSDDHPSYKVVLGHVHGDRQVRRSALSILRKEWRDRFKGNGGTRWTHCYRAGLISSQQANKSADCVWCA